MHHRFMCKKLWKSSWTDWIHKTLLLCCTDKYFIVAVYVSIYIYLCISIYIHFTYIFIYPFQYHPNTRHTIYTNRRIEGFQNIYNNNNNNNNIIYLLILIKRYNIILLYTSIDIYICVQIYIFIYYVYLDIYYSQRVHGIYTKKLFRISTSIWQKVGIES